MAESESGKAVSGGQEESGREDQPEEGAALIPDPAEKVRENEPGIGGG